MPKRPTNYTRPENVNEALQLLAQPNALPLGGGTKLLTGDVEGAVVDLQDLGLNQIDWTNDGLRVGATTTLSDLATALKPGGPADLLWQAIRQAGPNTYRNAATLGGTIASRLPDSELLAALLALDVRLTVQGEEMELVDYLTAAERPSGLIAAVNIPWTEGQGRSERVARTPVDYPIVSITCWQPQDGAPRLAATGLGKRPFRLTNAESHLANGLNEAAVEAAAQAAQAASVHPGDFRGDANYRAEMAAVLTRRVCK
ncbi:MAG: hypothetical protein GY803_09715 [Chloroflexi bacterium]|nr:hypothetical protein [Chloroflexota bacterium]